MLVEFRSNLARYAQIWTGQRKSVRFRPHLALARPNLADVRRMGLSFRSLFGSILFRVRPSWAWARPTFRPNLGWLRPFSGQFWPVVREFVPIPSEFGQRWLVLGQMSAFSAELGPSSANAGPDSTKFGRLRMRFAQFGLHFDPIAV